MRPAAWIELGRPSRVGQGKCTVPVTIHARNLSFGRMLWKEFMPRIEVSPALFKPLVFLWLWWKFTRIWP